MKRPGSFLGNMSAMKPRRDAAFTLVELLVAIGLMMVLISSLVLIFASTTATVEINRSRIQIHNAARAALEQLARDLTSMLPMDGGAQRFWMRDGGEKPINSAERNYIGATDSIGFRAVTSVKGVLTPAQVVYRVVLDPRGKSVEKVIGGNLVAGRQVYILRKEVLDLNGNALPDPTQSGKTVPAAADLCHYVVSFNLEYLAGAGQYSQIAKVDSPPPGLAAMPDGPFPGPLAIDPSSLVPVSVPPVDPMGESTDGADINDEVLPSGRQAPRFVVPAIRATLRIVEDIEARQERVFTREIWLPTG